MSPILAARSLLPLLYGVATFASGLDQASSQESRCASYVFSKPDIGRGATIVSVLAQTRSNFTSIEGGPLQPAVSNLSFCQVQVYLTHDVQDRFNVDEKVTEDEVLVEVWLPLNPSDWNGRLQATGGAGFAVGMFGAHLGAAVRDGWAAVSTDGGHDAALNKLEDASWVLSTSEIEDSRVDSYSAPKIRWDLLHNLASRSAMDQVLIGKSIIEQYYGNGPHHSYWNGCSTGGRQGYAIAQKDPGLLDGILAIAPAISFVNIVMGALWPQVVMNMAKTYLSNCELEYFRYRAIEECEKTMGTGTGILDNPSGCPVWSPKQIVGEKIECDGQAVTIDQAMAEIVQKIRDGPDGKFPGLEYGVPMTTLANVTTHENGTRFPNPFGISASWLQYAVLKGTPYDVSELDKVRLNSLWALALAEYGGILNNDDPDLSKLRDSGTKLLTWHGIDDQMIPYQNTVNYRRKVEAIMGGPHQVDEYFRLFLAPGVENCGGGVGPVPVDAMSALVHWVEDNEPPETLDAEGLNTVGELVTRNLCIWPATALYNGVGDPSRFSSWTCHGGTERPMAGEQIIENEFDYGMMQPPPDSKVHSSQGKVKHSRVAAGTNRAEQILGGLKDRIEGLGMGLRVE
ncbi:tannase and feruloyl esterase-domain-containing protein [Ampelomyces quisqualis]|uniref:Carboxylic ester hydrolase n=1 Tax=Ampelomyces quisqualis TaxID=50730 RepID=A0A6A5Q9D7_AMPQU|nr:tannase and feruloyl esterase-domain-containing protein [Ampelomyces quisqualis]